MRVVKFSLLLVFVLVKVRVASRLDWAGYDSLVRAAPWDHCGYDSSVRATRILALLH